MAGRSLACRERLEPNGDYRLRLWSQMFAQESEKPLLRLCAFTGAQLIEYLLPVQHQLMGEVFGSLLFKICFDRCDWCFEHS